MPDARTDTPACIAEALLSKCSVHAFGIKDSAPAAHEWKPTLVPVSVLADAVWEALLAEGEIREEFVYDGHREPTGRIRVLVVPLGVEAGT